MDFVAGAGAIELFEGDIRRDYVHSDDVARALLRAWESRPAPGVYNLGSGVAIGHREIADGVVAVARAAGLPLADPPIRTIPMPDTLRPRFQYYTRAEGVPPWIAELVADPMGKMVRYWTERVTR
jgi:nucleoside-diphosphate-sugar epimerase